MLGMSAVLTARLRLVSARRRSPFFGCISVADNQTTTQLTGSPSGGVATADTPNASNSAESDGRRSTGATAYATIASLTTARGRRQSDSGLLWVWILTYRWKSSSAAIFAYIGRPMVFTVSMKSAGA